MSDAPFHDAPDILAREGACRFLASARAALPLREDFWEALAWGIGIDAPELAAILDACARLGVCSGAWMEPDPALDGVREALVLGDGVDVGGTMRWTGRGGCSTLRSILLDGSEAEDAWPAVRWFKAGVIPLLPGEADDLLAAETDRTQRIAPTAPATLSDEAQAALRALATPLPIAPPASPFEAVAQYMGIARDQARTAVAEALTVRRARRFALRLSPHGLGMRGCGLACWSLEDSEVAPAAAALASIRGSAEVAARRATDAFPYNLSALFLAWDAGAGEAAARRVAAQWDRPLGRWIDLDLS